MLSWFWNLCHAGHRAGQKGSYSDSLEAKVVSATYQFYDLSAPQLSHV